MLSFLWAPQCARESHAHYLAYRIQAGPVRLPSLTSLPHSLCVPRSSLLPLHPPGQLQNHVAIVRAGLIEKVVRNDHSHTAQSPGIFQYFLTGTQLAYGKVGLLVLSFPFRILCLGQHPCSSVGVSNDGLTFLNITSPSNTLLKHNHSSSSSSALSPYASNTGVLCVCHPVIVFGLPAWPTTSTACPTLTFTVSGFRFSSRVIRNRGYMAVTRKYSR